MTLYGRGYTTTYLGTVITRNGFGEWEATVHGIDMIFATVARAKDAILYWHTRTGDDCGNPPITKADRDAYAAEAREIIRDAH